MLIENESNWNTQDLKAMVEAVMELEGFRKGSHIYEDTLLLFKTSRKRGRKNWKGKRDEPPAAYAVRNQNYSNTVIVEIRSKDKLKLDLLGRMAHINESGHQDMSSDDVKCLLKEIKRALSSYIYSQASVAPLVHMPLRMRSKITRSKVVIDREIEGLQDKCRSWQRHLDREIEKVNEKIDSLRRKRSKL